MGAQGCPCNYAINCSNSLLILGRAKPAAIGPFVSFLDFGLFPGFWYAAKG